MKTLRPIECLILFVVALIVGMVAYSRGFNHGVYVGALKVISENPDTAKWINASEDERRKMIIPEVEIKGKLKRGK